MTLSLESLMTETGLEWPALPSYEEWADLGPRISLVGNTSRWALADWLNLGEERWPDRAAQAVDRLGLDYHTLENYRWVGKRVPPQVRRPLPVSFSHHMLIARLAVEEQDHWLSECMDKGWTREEFRTALILAGLSRDSLRREEPVNRRLERAELLLRQCLGWLPGTLKSDVQDFLAAS